MIAQADAFRIPLPNQSVHCAVSSPPYWGLRKYAGNQGDEPLGLEPTPERHIERIVEICREVRRVLRDDGVFWLNYGDCYGHGTSAKRPQGNTRGIADGTAVAQNINRHGGEAGNLMMMPHRVALALQQDGWIVRQDLVWFKRNPMPESVNGWRWQREREKLDRSEQAKTMKVKGGHKNMIADPAHHKGVGPDWLAEYEYGDDLELRKGSWRHTRAHEYVFMLVKGMQYWSNQEAVREGFRTNENENYPERSHILGRGGLESLEQSPDGGAQRRASGGYPPSGSGRNPRSVLDIPTAPYKGAHYATFPPNLIAPLIRATCPRWACPVCGQGWAAVVEHSHVAASEGWEGKWRQADPQASARRMSSNTRARRESGESHDHPFPSPSVLGYRPTCEHPHIQEEAVPGIVFDPFVGSGTTVAVAQQLLRRGIGIDISMEYLDQQAKIRAGLGTPSNALDDLPLFGNIMAIKAE